MKTPKLFKTEWIEGSKQFIRGKQCQMCGELYPMQMAFPLYLSLNPDICKKCGALSETFKETPIVRQYFRRNKWIFEERCAKYSLPNDVIIPPTVEYVEKRR